MANKKVGDSQSDVVDIKKKVNRNEREGRGAVLPNDRDILNILGGLSTVTVIPTTAPKKYADSIVIYLDSLTSPTTKRLYVFSREGNLWNYVTLT